jgi:Flp pilus assembly protein TadD
VTGWRGWSLLLLVVIGIGLRLPDAWAAVRRNWVMSRVNRSMLQLHDEGAAVEILRASVERGGDPSLERHLGGLRTERGDIEEAEALLGDAVARRPHDPLARLFYGHALAARGRTREAVEQWRVANVGDYFTVEAEATLDHDAARAERFLRRARTLDPEDETALWLTGRSRQARGDLEGAVTWFLRAYEVSANPERLVDAGTVRIEQKRFAEAGEHFRAALSARPRTRVYAIHLGDSLRLAGDLEGAREWYTRALSFDGPDAALAERYLGELELENGRPGRAIQHLTIAVELLSAPSTQMATTLFSLARAQLALNRSGDAEATLRRAVLLSPTNAHFRLILGELLVGQRRRDEAERELRLAVQYSGSNIGIRTAAMRLLDRVRTF